MASLSDRSSFTSSLVRKLAYERRNSTVLEFICGGFGVIGFHVHEGGKWGLFDFIDGLNNNVIFNIFLECVSKKERT